MKPSILRCMFSSRRLKWWLVIECLVAVLVLQHLWADKAARQQAHDHYRYQEHKWRLVTQSMRVLPLDLSVEMLRQGETVVGMRIRDRMRLDQWYSLINSLQKRYWLAPQSIHWQRDNGLWFADITWNFVRPATLKPELNILPFDQLEGWSAEGQLISTLHGERDAALIQIDHEEVWWQEGAWLPQLEATLAKVDQEYIEIRNNQGHVRQLYLNGVPATALIAKEP